MAALDAHMLERERDCEEQSGGPTHLGWLVVLYCFEKSISKLPNLSASSSNWSQESIESSAECGDSTFIRLASCSLP